MSMIFNALSGAIAAQAALNTNSQNIANAMTPGYTRQGVLLGSVQPGSSGSNAAGAGVAVSGLLRFNDGYKSLQMWQAASNLGQYKAGQPYLNQLEQVMSDDTSNINQGLDAFFAALNAASVQPDSGPLREQVITAADGLVKRVGSLQSLLSGQQSALLAQRGAAIDQVNSHTQSIALLNKQIAAAQATGINTSGLLDARDQQVDALSSLAGLQVVNQPDGTISVSLKNGQPLVLGSEAAVMSQNAGDLELSFANSSFKVLGQNLGGQLGGLQDFETQVLKPMQSSIGELAQGIATSFNTQLAAGSAPPVVGPGQPLFDYSGGKLKLTGLTATQLAFAAPGGAIGDSSNLKALIGLKSQTISVDGKLTVMGDVYTQLVGKLGVQSQQNIAAQKTAITVRDQAEESWKSTSGVNNDEEAISLMQYKQMYEANMKVVAVANALFDSTLAMIR
ncbi:flagellar hook-associated protein FlgK [Paucibacter sp. XJ19-41]|uniref:flagellar hook-associated protein FlgK n=1 Tax=Paucibacter sp. XJ19-41 TaxID=2927824 RepID=UPI00234B76AB|nr:flagellar hook-associated protein FlgK [Paucibacter sp. XJ19-41]MDC6170937.1 flagellar hook-associated protein FlgK [Paucibacter sp. XJ19-41]